MGEGATEDEAAAAGASPPAPRGLFGQANYSYTPPRTLQEIRKIARQYGEAALHTLAMIAGDSDVNAAVRVAACVALLDRGYGKVAPVPGGLPDDEGPRGPSGKLSQKDLVTMDDATLAKVLMDEVGRH